MKLLPGRIVWEQGQSPAKCFQCVVLSEALCGPVKPQILQQLASTLHTLSLWILQSSVVHIT